MASMFYAVLCASLIMCGTGVSAFFIAAPVPIATGIRSPYALSAVQRSSRIPVTAMSTISADTTVGEQAQSTAEDFAVEFADIHASFEKRSAGPLSIPLGDRNTRRVVGAGLASVAPFIAGVTSASAKGGAYGIVEGRTASFLHPTIMAVLFAVSVRSGILGLQWREQRTMGTRISEMKEQLPILSTGSRASIPLSAQADGIRAKLSELGDDAVEAAGFKADLDKLVSAAAKDVEAELEKMAVRRKELSSQNVRDRHYDMGAILLGLGTFAAIQGPVNTFLRAEKLFPGPHLYAGAGIVVAWAVAASLVPQMTKGNETARIAHIAINFGMIALFSWQLFTGFEIAVKVWEFTKWP